MVAGRDNLLLKAESPEVLNAYQKAVLFKPIGSNLLINICFSTKVRSARLCIESTPHQEQGRQLISKDTQLQRDVLAELNWEPSVNSAHIGVMANAGVVTLTGHVESFAEKYAAEKAAGRVKGVKAVAQEIEVRLAFDRKRGDDEIAAAAIERLAWDTFVPHDAVKVKVDNGWIALTGQVEWVYQKEAAEQDVRRLLGVVGVSNQATVRPRPSAPDISDDIIHALRRSWLSNPKTIEVSVDGGDVRLTGTVHSLQDWRVAEATAWAAPGANYVANEITII